MVLLTACNGNEVISDTVESEGETAVVASLTPTSAPVEQPVTGTTYTLTQSEARFTLDEDLRGERVTVVGRTDQVSGQVTVDLANPTAAQISPIEIDAATIATDHDMRNRAINRFILVTSSFPTITYTSTGTSGLPDSITIGESATFIINGELGITDITLPITFEATVTAVSATRLEGHAATRITRDDFGLTIPSVPSVANVDEQVLLEFEFIAESE